MLFDYNEIMDGPKKKTINLNEDQRNKRRENMLKAREKRQENINIRKVNNIKPVVEKEIKNKDIYIMVSDLQNKINDMYEYKANKRGRNLEKIEQKQPLNTWVWNEKKKETSVDVNNNYPSFFSHKRKK